METGRSIEDRRIPATLCALRTAPPRHVSRGWLMIPPRVCTWGMHLSHRHDVERIAGLIGVTGPEHSLRVLKAGGAG